MTQPVTQPAIDLVKHFEGLYLKAYLCPAGVPTIGYGATGPDIRLGMTWTKEQAEARLASDLSEAAADVDRYVKVPLTPEQRGALASFVFNLGPGALASSTLLKLLNSGDTAGAAGQFGRWVYATVNGKPTRLAGLMARRAAEASLFGGERRLLVAQVADGAQEGRGSQTKAAIAPAGPDADRIRRIQAIVGVQQDGHYGPVTRAAVTIWQAANHLHADGIVGPVTAKAMGL